MDLLEPDHQHRPVMLVQDGLADLDRVVGPDCEEQAVEGGVVQLAERDAVADNRFALGVAIGSDVRSVEQFLVVQAAQGTSLLVRPDDPFTEHDLV